MAPKNPMPNNRNANFVFESFILHSSFPYIYSLPLETLVQALVANLKIFYLFHTFKKRDKRAIITKRFAR